MKRIIMLSVAVISMLEAKDGNQLQKIFLHTMQPSQAQKAHIELAKLVFYFSHEPEIRTEQHKGGNINQAKISFFFPGVATSQEVIAMIDLANKAKTDKYTLHIQEVAKPSKGIELLITFNPEQIMIKHDTFDAITRAKGVEFHIYNKQLLHDLQLKGTNVLRTTQVIRPLIIIDAGHGGTDFGTISKGGLAEKSVTLALSKQLESELKRQGFQVCMTRANDTFIALDARTKMVNAKNNAVFISLHGNNAPNKTVRGLETFCLDSHLFKPVDMQLATAIDVIINSIDEQKNLQSKKLAREVHSAILAEFNSKGFLLPDRKVKNAATQVLMGITCPGALIEIDFLSNSEVENNLQQPEYRSIYVQGICNGIRKYISG